MTSATDKRTGRMWSREKKSSTANTSSTYFPIIRLWSDGFVIVLSVIFRHVVRVFPVWSRANEWESGNQSTSDDFCRIFRQYWKLSTDLLFALLAKCWIRVLDTDSTVTCLVHDADAESQYVSCRLDQIFFDTIHEITDDFYQSSALHSSKSEVRSCLEKYY